MHDSPDWRAALKAAFRAHLFDAPSTEDLFNPYRDRDPALDLEDAPAIRQANLLAVPDAYPERPRILLVAEAPGPRGCRLSGVPFVSEAQLCDPAFPSPKNPLGGRPSSPGAPTAEYSGGIFWRVVRPYWPGFFVWNSVPLHPHRAGDPMSIRAPRVREIKAWLPLLEAVLQALEPQTLIAVGRKAESALGRIGREAHYVRHPSQGGATAFERGLRDLLGPPPG